MKRLRLATPISRDVSDRAQAELPPRAREIPGFKALYVIEVSDDEVVLLVVGDSTEALDRVAGEIGNTWMRENVIPHLTAAPERQVGEVVTSSEM